jgi:hypothetical protein
MVAQLQFAATGLSRRIHPPGTHGPPPPRTHPTPAPLPNLIFASRWLQLPLYLGLILAQAVYVFHFWVELAHLIEAAFGNKDACTSWSTASATRARKPSPT